MGRAFLSIVFLFLLLPLKAIAGTDPRISLQDTAGGAGQLTDLTVNFTEGSSAVSATQFDLMFPASVSVVSVTAGAVVTNASKTVSSADISGGHRVIIFGLNQDPLGSGVLVTIRLQLSPSAVPGTDIPLSLSGLLSSNSNGDPEYTDGSGAILSVVAPDLDPPVISLLSPLSALPAGTTAATVSVATNEVAECRYAIAADTLFSAMSETLAPNSDNLTHSVGLTELESGAARSYYVRCKDSQGNENSTDFIVTAEVLGYQAAIHRDFNADGKSDLVLGRRGSARVYLSDEAPADGAVLERRTGNLRLVPGQLSRAGKSSLLFTTSRNGVYQWNSFDIASGKRRKVASLVSAIAARPVFDCRKGGRLLPVVSVAGREPRVVFKVGSRLRSVSIPSASFLCSPESNSQFYVLKSRRVFAYNQRGKRTFRSAILPSSLRQQRLLVLPQFGSNSATAAVLGVSSAGVELLTPQGNGWRHQILGISTAGIKAAVVGNHGGGYRWVVVQTAEKQLILLKLRDSGDVYGVETLPISPDSYRIN